MPMNYYSDNAKTLCDQYNTLSPEDVHCCWVDLLPPRPALACDIGAGSGRDTAWLVRDGWNVIAVEPNLHLRSLGEEFTKGQAATAVTWLDDSLPELNNLRSVDQKFQLILISGVWMHMPPSQYECAMRNISEVLAPGGLLIITLRQGPDEANRFYPVNADEVIRLAQSCTLITKRVSHTADLTRTNIEWDTLVFARPYSTI